MGVEEMDMKERFSIMRMEYSVLKEQPVRLAYQPSANSTFLSEQISHQQPASSTFLSEQISTSHQPNEQAGGFQVSRVWMVSNSNGLCIILA
jgi:hypothetical protein